MPSLVLIANCSDRYQEGILLSGIIYVHSMIFNSNSVFPLALGNICGITTLGKVMLVTTMWDKVTSLRTTEQKLEPLTRSWYPLINGTVIKRFDNSSSSAWEILDYFIRREKNRAPLLLQEQMADWKMKFSETTAGRFRDQFPNATTSVLDEKWQIIREFSALQAIHNSEHRHDPPKCHPNTRIAIRDTLMDWVVDTADANARIMWFYGPAGAGKSAIAQTLAETVAG